MQTIPGTIGGNLYYQGQIATASLRNIKGAYGQFYSGEALPLPLGRLIVLGSNPREGKLPTTASGKILGITINYNASGRALIDQTAGNTLTYAPKQQLNLLTIGDVVVWSEEAVTFNDPVYYRYANGTLGQFRKSAVASEAALLNSAKWITTTTGAGLAVMSIFGWMF